MIINGLGLSLNGSGHYVVGNLIKFFPMAYYVVIHSSATPLALSVPCIQGDGCNDPDCEVTLDVRLDSIPPISWPEMPGPRHRTMMPPELAHVAHIQPRTRDRKRRRKGRGSG